MTLQEALNAYAPGKNHLDYDVQVNYTPVEPREFSTWEVKDEDIVRLSKPFEMPLQFIVGEEPDGV